jgi:ATP-dependent DNA helicase HFM1/MER3
LPDFNDCRFKAAERTILRELNKSPFIRYPVKGNVAETWHKVYLLVQGQLGAADLSQGQTQGYAARDLTVERSIIIERMQRYARCLCECKAADRDGVSLHNALELTRCLIAGSWDHRPTQITQIDGIGPVAMRKLVSQNVRTVAQLAAKQPSDIDRLMTRNAPYGKKMSESLEKFPRLTLDATITGRAGSGRPKRTAVTVNVKAVLGYANRVPPSWKSRQPSLTFMASTSDGILAFIWRGSTKMINKDTGHELLFHVELASADVEIDCHFSCEEIVGTIVTTTLQHNIPARDFPKATARRPSTQLDHHKPSSNSKEEVDMDDNLLLQATLRAEAALEEQAQDVDFADIDEVLNVNKGLQIRPDMTRSQSDACEDQIIPIQLANGRWQCNHICSGGGLTRSGKLCHHKCCKEGSNKPHKRGTGKRSEDDDPDVAEGASSNSRDVNSQRARKKARKGETEDNETRQPTSPPTFHPAAKVYAGGYGNPFDVIDLSMVADDISPVGDAGGLVSTLDDPNHPNSLVEGSTGGGKP